MSRLSKEIRFTLDHPPKFIIQEWEVNYSSKSEPSREIPSTSIAKLAEFVGCVEKDEIYCRRRPLLFKRPLRILRNCLSGEFLFRSDPERKSARVGRGETDVSSWFYSGLPVNHSDMISQLEFDWVRAQIDLFLEAGLVVFAHIMIEEGEGDEQGKEASAVEIDVM